MIPAPTKWRCAAFPVLYLCKLNPLGFGLLVRPNKTYEGILHSYLTFYGWEIINWENNYLIKQHWTNPGLQPYYCCFDIAVKSPSFSKHTIKIHNPNCHLSLQFWNVPIENIQTQTDLQAHLFASFKTLHCINDYL